MVEVFSASAAAAPRAMAMVDTKFVPLLLRLPCIGVAVEEYRGNALYAKLNRIIVSSYFCLAV